MRGMAVPYVEVLRAVQDREKERKKKLVIMCIL